MAITKIELEKFTVFDSLEIDFSKGINVFIGENGAGKTHAMKLLYSACQASQVQKTAIDFPAKIARTFKPDNLSLHRLVRRGSGNSTAKIVVSSDKAKLSLEFNAKYKKNITIEGAESWNKQFSDLISTFIPAKEILSHARNLTQAIEKGNVDFDDTYRDIIAAASIDLSRGPESDKTQRYLKKLNEIIKGTVRIENDEFYLLQGNQSKLEFQLVAEGLRKIALLWQLIKNGTLGKGSILFWDEPEANINPMQIPAIVDMLLELQRDGVQIFVATHDYFFAKYLEVRKQKEDEILFHVLFKSGGVNSAACHDSANSFSLLENNSILMQSINLYKEEVKKVME
jgi:predicted ATP-dependent endonuclease of OLD family